MVFPTICDVVELKSNSLPFLLWFQIHTNTLWIFIFVDFNPMTNALNINNTFIAFRFSFLNVFRTTRDCSPFFFYHLSEGLEKKKKETIKEKWYNKNVSFHCVLQFGKKKTRSEVLCRGCFLCCFDICFRIVCQQKYKYTTRYLTLAHFIWSELKNSEFKTIVNWRRNQFTIFN